MVTDGIPEASGTAVTVVVAAWWDGLAWSVAGLVGVDEQPLRGGCPIH